MSDYILHYSPDSANIVVRAALEEAGARYRSVLVDRGAGAQRSPEYLALNPQGLLPVLVDGDVVLFETAAIALYLSDRHSGLGPTPGSAHRGDLYRWLFYLSNTVHADLRVLFYTHRHVADASIIPALREGTQSRLLMHLSLLDRVMARHGGDYLLASGFSVCDLYLAFCCRWLMIYPQADAGFRGPVPAAAVRAHRRVWSLLERLEARPAVDAACRAEWIEPPGLTAPRVPDPPAGSVTG